MTHSWQSRFKVMDRLKWEVCFFLLVTSLFHARSDLRDKCPSNTVQDNQVNCTFEIMNCAWENTPMNDNIKWTKRYDAASENYYMRLSMESAKVNEAGRFRSLWICNAQGKEYNLHFQYRLKNTYNYQLSVYIQTRKSYYELLKVRYRSTGNAFASVTSPTIISTNCEFQIIVEGKKIRKHKGGSTDRIDIDDINLISQPGTELCPIQTTVISARSSKRPSYTTSSTTTTQPSKVHGSTTSSTRSYPYSEGQNLTTGNGYIYFSGSNEVQNINENGSSHLSTGAIVAIAASVLVITIGIIVIIACRRNVKRVCETSELFKRIQINTKPNSNFTGHFANNSMYSAEDEQISVPSNHRKPYRHGGYSRGTNQGYEISEVTSSSQYYSAMNGADAKRETSQTSPDSIPERNLKSVTNSDADDYNTLHVTPQRVATDAYDHVHTEPDHSHKKTVQEDNVYSLARITAHNTDTNASGNSNRNPSPSTIDEYNRLNISGVNFPNGDKHSTDFYDHLDVDTVKNHMSTESLPTTSPSHHSIGRNHEGDYNHLQTELSRDQYSHAAKHYDHLEAMADHSPNEPLEGDNAYSLADVSFSRDYVNTNVNPSGIILNDVD